MNLKDDPRVIRMLAVAGSPVQRAFYEAIIEHIEKLEETNANKTNIKESRTKPVGWS